MGVLACSTFGAPREAQALFGLFDCPWFRPAPTYAPTNCGYPPPSACGQPVAPGTIARYVPVTAYRQELVSTPVTTYRPAACCDPSTGQAVSTYRPYQVMVSQVQLVPYTTYRVVSANPCGNLASCSTCPTPGATRAMYPSTTAYYGGSTYTNASYPATTAYYAPSTSAYYAPSVPLSPGGCNSCRSAAPAAPYYTTPPRTGIPDSSTIPPSIPRGTPVPSVPAPTSTYPTPGVGAGSTINPAPVYPAPTGGAFAPATPAAPSVPAATPAPGGNFSPAPAAPGSNFNSGGTYQRPITSNETPASVTSPPATVTSPSTTGGTGLSGTSAPATPSLQPSWGARDLPPASLPTYDGGIQQDRSVQPPRTTSLPSRFASQQQWAAPPTQQQWSGQQPPAQPLREVVPAAPRLWSGADDSGWESATRSW